LKYKGDKIGIEMILSIVTDSKKRKKSLPTLLKIRVKLLPENRLFGLN